MSAPRLALPIFQRAPAGVVGILHGAECLLGGLDRNAAIGVVHDHPNELLGLELGRGDQQAVDRSGGLGFGLHFRNMTTTVSFDKRLGR